MLPVKRFGPDFKRYIIIKIIQVVARYAIAVQKITEQ